MTTSYRSALCACGLILAACGGGAATSTNDNGPSGPRTASGLLVVSGDAQTGTVGQELSVPMVAQVVDSSGAPVAGQIVNFRPTVGGGSVFAGAAISDATGYVRERWTLGPSAGAQKLEARAIDSNGNPIVYATFSASANHGPATTISANAGNGQTGQQGQQLPAAVTAHVVDQYGNPVAGVQVAFVPAPNCGAVSASTATTDVAGNASSSWTLGPYVGQQSVTASAAGVGSTIFNATVATGAVQAALAIASGDGQTGYIGAALSTPVVFTLKTLAGTPIAGQTVSFTTPDGGSASPSSSVTDSTGKAQTTWTLSTAIQLQHLEARATDPATGLPVSTAAAKAMGAAGPPAAITVYTGNNQTQVQKFALPQRLNVKVVDPYGNPVPSTTVTFTPAASCGTASPTTNTTDSYGVTGTWWTLGTVIGQETLVASAGSATLTFKATALQGTPYDGVYAVVPGQGIDVWMSHQLGGTYTCGAPNLTISVINGAISGDKNASGTVDSSGNIAWTTSPLNDYGSFQGTLSTSGTGSGTYAYGANLSCQGGKWTATRQ